MTRIYEASKHRQEFYLKPFVNDQLGNKKVADNFDLIKSCFGDKKKTDLTAPLRLHVCIYLLHVCYIVYIVLSD